MANTGFKRNKEDFDCEQCGEHVIGNGYTNHCPNCLWSKHVDVDPGDRAATCHGAMEPREIQTKGAEYVIAHTCVRCGHVKNNKISRDDNMEKAIAIATAHAKTS